MELWMYGCDPRSYQICGHHLQASFFVAVTPEAIKYVAFIYEPSLTCRHLHADHSGTHSGYPQVTGTYQVIDLTTLYMQTPTR